LKILVACEESQAVTIELRKLGHEAYSCDILPCSGGHPEWHLQEDVVPLLNQTWDMIIAFPPCTYLTVTGNRWFNEEKYGDNAIKRKEDRKDAINFFMLFANANCEKIAIENPVGIMSSQWRKPNQIIQPWMFGDGFEKKTCLWLKGLPNLTPTNIVVPPARKIFDSGKSMPTLGIAKAMAKQWTMIKEEFYHRKKDSI
jgi:site-specific DNA-cytosine methylase